MKENIQKVIINISIFVLIVFPVLVLGQVGTTGGTPPDASISFKIENPFIGKDASLTGILKAVLTNIVMPIAAVVVVLAIIYSGFKFVTANGNPGEIDKAKTGLLYVLIGALILLGAEGISKAIEGTLSSIVKP
jgi:type IV secretory pathway VirB2 component (pilin)